jgi:hypothetical protein
MGKSLTPQPQYPRKRKAVPTVEEAGWAPRPVWTGVENLAPTGFDPRTVQPVQSRYEDYIIPDRVRCRCFKKKRERGGGELKNADEPSYSFFLP